MTKIFWGWRSENLDAAVQRKLKVISKYGIGSSTKLNEYRTEIFQKWNCIYENTLVSLRRAEFENLFLEGNSQRQFFSW